MMNKKFCYVVLIITFVAYGSLIFYNNRNRDSIFSNSHSRHFDYVTIKVPGNLTKDFNCYYEPVSTSSDLPVTKGMFLLTFQLQFCECM